MIRVPREQPLSFSLVRGPGFIICHYWNLHDGAGPAGALWNRRPVSLRTDTAVPPGADA